MRLSAALVVVWLLSVTQTSAADNLELGVLGASLADLASTEYGLRSCAGCYEANPLGGSTVSRAALKAASGALVIVATRKLAKTHPKVSKAIKIGLIVLYGGAAVHNTIKARR